VKTKTVYIVHSPVRTSGEDGAARARILDAARKLFLERGFLRTTADDIARELGISKATLYKTFRSKDEILRVVVRETMAEIQAGVEGLVDDASLGFVERIAALLAFLADRMSRLGPVLVRDIQRAVPDLWQEVLDFRRDKILRNFGIILESGRSEGFFRADVDPDILLQMFLNLVQQFVTPDEVRRTGRSPAVLLGSVIKVFFQGILTDKGRLDLSARTPAWFEPRKEGAS
jgi:AcrR family transcriptional regulator